MGSLCLEFLDIDFFEIGLGYQPDINKVWFDCELRQRIFYDIQNNIFNGDNLVYWGFTSSRLLGKLKLCRIITRVTMVKMLMAT